MILKFGVLFLLLCCSTQAAARMYQWVDPSTGITQLSGKPPPWYRSGVGGPRVFVFEQGRIIDDTGIKVPATDRELLRQQALLDARQNTGKGGKVLRDVGRAQAARKQEGSKQPSAKKTKPSGPSSEPDTGSRPPSKERPAVTPPPTAQEKAMKAVISRWEKSRADQARKIVGAEGAAPDAPPPPPPGSVQP